MKHVPHLVVGAPWDGHDLELSVVQWRHVNKVLRIGRGDTVTYTDGLGRRGTGKLGHQNVERGVEEDVPRPTTLTMAVAPPANKDRQRYLVEKLAELGVAHLVWLRTEHGQVRVANPSKVFTWVLSATEQSRGAWLMDVSKEPTGIGDLVGSMVFCDQGGVSDPGKADIVVVGPEGGFAADEIPDGATRWDLGPTVLRVETAAVVAAAQMRHK